MDTREISLSVDEGGLSQAVAISTSSAQSAAISGKQAIVTCTTAAFVRRGSNPTALSNGTDMYLPAGTTFRLAINPGDKLAFITPTGAGTAYITPEQ